MTASASRRRRPLGRVPAFWAAAAGLAILLLLFFFLINDTWVPLRTPRLAGGGGSAPAEWEIHFSALVLVPFGLGAAGAALLGRRARAAERRKAAEHRERATRLEAEIERISRLLSSSRGGNRILP